MVIILQSHPLGYFFFICLSLSLGKSFSSLLWHLFSSLQVRHPSSPSSSFLLSVIAIIVISSPLPLSDHPHLHRSSTTSPSPSSFGFSITFSSFFFFCCATASLPLPYLLAVVLSWLCICCYGGVHAAAVPFHHQHQPSLSSRHFCVAVPS